MQEKIDYLQARRLLLQLTAVVETETVPLEKAWGRILGQALAAQKPVPEFDRSPYDGYALRAQDTLNASPEQPVILQITQEIPAGRLPLHPVAPGTAAKILTGAPIPDGADCVVMYESTEFTARQVKLFHPVCPGQNVVRAGEDVKQGQCLAEKGCRIDPGLAGSMAAQGMQWATVYRRPVIGLISTGDEVCEPGDEPTEGHIYNTNRFTLEAALEKEGCCVKYLGLAGDRAQTIAEKIRQGLECCDWVMLTGGVSAGDYDLTPEAMRQAGVECLVHGVAIKPGMACAYGQKEGKLVCALSGNPASAAANFYAVVLPALRRLCGWAQPIPEQLELTVEQGFPKPSKCPRLLWGKLDLSKGTVRMNLPSGQGNAIISGTIGCDVVAMIPRNSGPLEPGSRLKGFLI